MKSKLTLIIFFAALTSSTFSYGQSKINVVDKLNVPGPILIEKRSHILVWTSHPSANYYKQEYIPKGEIVSKFKSMVLLEVSLENASLKDIVNAKVSELKKMKETNPIINYEIFEKKGEFILDFLLSANSPDGKSIDIVERNIYRYKTFTDRSGQKAILLFAVSVRGYGNDVDKFLTDLKSNKQRLLNEVAQFTIPEITISK